MYTIDDLCLLCLVNNKSLKCILSSDSDGLFVEEKLSFFLLDFVNIEPEISKYICLHCLKNLNHVYNFKQQCIRNIVKFNSYIHALKTTEEPCRNLQVMLFDMKHLEEHQVKSENESNSKPMKTASINFDNVIVKKESNEDDTGMEYVLQDEHVQKTEVDVDILRKEDNYEEKGYGTIIDNNKTEKENIRGGSMIADDEVKIEIVDEILEDVPENIENDIKPELDDKSKDTLQNETTNNADKSRYVIGDDVLDKEHADIHCEIHVKEDSHYDSEDKLQSEETINTEYVSTSDWRSIDERSPKSYKYNKCNKAYKDDSALINHKESYASENRFKCDVCDNGFVKKAHFIRHKLIHSGKKPYKCDLCDYKCSQKSNLTRHKVKHSGMKSYKCDLCDYKCHQKYNLTRHKVKHSVAKPHQCDVCDKGFVQKSDLISHKLIHSGMKPYKCDLCDYKCRQNSNLKSHKVNIHSGNKPHQCDVCDKGFELKARLIKHKLIHTGIQTIQMWPTTDLLVTASKI